MSGATTPKESSPVPSSPALSDFEPDLLERFAGDLRRTYMRESKFDKKPSQFFPRDRLKDVLSDLTPGPRNAQKEVHTVLELMRISQIDVSSQARALADYVLSEAKVIFLIAIYSEIAPLNIVMTIFKENNINDSHLPFPMWNLKNSEKNHPCVRQERKHRKERDHSRGSASYPYSVWSLGSIDRFQEAQWEFLAAVISAENPYCDFGLRAMPFTAKGDTPISGAHGVVCRYEVHSAHYSDTSCSVSSAPTEGIIITDVMLQSGVSPVIAVKAFRKNRKNVVGDWKREVDALARMNELNSDHIVRFITAFRRGDEKDLEYYVAFEWADGGNLGNLWDNVPEPELSAPRMRWAIKELHGLAQALAKAHYLEGGVSCRHGDLKTSQYFVVH